MNEKEKALLQQEILKLEAHIAAIQEDSISDKSKNVKESLDSIQESIKHMKDIAWDKESKKESNKMYKVLENEKPSTIVRSNVGNVIVDSELIQKEKEKHLDDPVLRGMVTTQEFLSFPKVAKNVEAKYDKQHQNYTWKVKANDESVLAYGSREYVKDDKEINRLLTTYSETEYGERQDRGERGHSLRQINDPDFLRPASETIPQNNKNTNTTLPNVSDSTLAKMQQKIEAYTQKQTHKENLKHQGKDTGVER